MRKRLGIVVLLALVVSMGTPVVYTCPVDSTFRAYLDRRFWQPFAKFVADLAKDLPPRKEQTVDFFTGKPFAGMSTIGFKRFLQAVRDVYRPLSRSGDSSATPTPPEEASA